MFTAKDRFARHFSCRRSSIVLARTVYDKNKLDDMHWRCCRFNKCHLCHHAIVNCLAARPIVRSASRGQIFSKLDDCLSTRDEADLTTCVSCHCATHKLIIVRDALTGPRRPGWCHNTICRLLAHAASIVNAPATLVRVPINFLVVDFSKLTANQ